MQSDAKATLFETETSSKHIPACMKILFAYSILASITDDETVFVPTTKALTGKVLFATIGRTKRGWMGESLPKAASTTTSPDGAVGSTETAHSPSFRETIRPGPETTRHWTSEALNCPLTPTFNHAFVP